MDTPPDIVSLQPLDALEDRLSLCGMLTLKDNGFVVFAVHDDTKETHVIRRIAV